MTIPRATQKKHDEALRLALKTASQIIYDTPPKGVGLIEWQFGGGAEQACAEAFRRLLKSGNVTVDVRLKGRPPK